MADLPWMKFYPGDFMIDTQHLRPAELGHHVRLQCLAWRRVNCAIPSDPVWIKRFLRVSDEEYEHDVVSFLDEFWPQEGDDRVNEALRRAYFEALSRSDKSRDAALTRHHGPNVQALKRRGNS